MKKNFYYCFIEPSHKYMKVLLLTYKTRQENILLTF
jgi:hypothetical protein